MIDPNQITYGDPQFTTSGNICTQDIIWEGKVIGVLVQRQRGCLSPIEETWQFGCPSDQVPEGAKFQEDEDEGWVFVLCPTLENFLDINIYINK